jgi:dihydrolipoamide dehydrogenase
MRSTGMRTDVIIIGSGPGGYVAAIRAAQLGLKTAIVEREHLGGICLNWGCIPTKALLRSAEVYHYAAARQGLRPGRRTSASTRGHREALARRRGPLNGGVGFLMKKNKVDVIWGEAKIDASPAKVTARPTKKPVQPQNPAAEGRARRRAPTGQAHHRRDRRAAARAAGLEPDGKLIWTYFEAMVPDEMPKSLLVIGSGAIGIEFASFYRTMGAEVTVVEVLPQILPVEDAEIAAFARKRSRSRASRSSPTPR